MFRTFLFLILASFFSQTGYAAFPPLRISAVGGIPQTTYFNGFPLLYEKLPDSVTATVQAGTAIIDGDWLLDRPVALTVQGGYDGSYSSQNGFTTVGGAIMVSAGSLTANGLIVGNPASTVLGQLTGSGSVSRTQNTYSSLMTVQSSISMQDDGAFALPSDAAMPDHVFSGRMTLSSDIDNPVTNHLLRYNSAGYSVSDPQRWTLPSFDFKFVQDGSYLIPVTQGLSITGHAYWNYIIGPGRVWRETSDPGYSRASFPFALVERDQNCTHNGVMTFLFNNSLSPGNVSKVHYQISQETCAYFKFDMAGQLNATYTPETVTEAATVKADFRSELANRLPVKPIAELATDFPTAGVNLANIGKSHLVKDDLNAYWPDIKTYGLVVNGINYVGNCQTRYGEYPYCDSMRLPSYSTAKSAFAGIALMRLGQLYGKDTVNNARIVDYINPSEYTGRPGFWDSFDTTTFKNTLDMATGRYYFATFETDENYYMTDFFNAESYTDKIYYAFKFPKYVAPGVQWIYHSSDSFMVTRAMNNYLIYRTGDTNKDIFNMVRDDVFKPLHLSAGALTTERTDNSVTGVPIGAFGLFWTQDDISKIALLLNNQGGANDGVQILQPDMLAEAMQQIPGNRGLITDATYGFNYNYAFWAKNWGAGTTPSYGCSFYTPFMSGYGGITVAMIPNGSVYYEFRDSAIFDWYDAIAESNKVKPICP